MTHNFGFRLAHAVGHYGLSADADGWPASLEHAAPFLSIVVNELGPDEAGAWIDGARRAHARENEARLARTYKFGFPHYLTLELGDFENTLARVAAWEASRPSTSWRATRTRTWTWCSTAHGVPSLGSQRPTERPLSPPSGRSSAPRDAAAAPR
ncbi:hypothetical protein [Streptomyces sp. A30]|uniref:hypothetical protein n=1 Tax=Streptomyces sp. A30 TaxID=2789273 RepID=UPI003980168D